jgi:DNA-binding transcriptional regulator YbjK
MPTPVRQRILGAALSLIQRRGIERVTTREIAMAAGAAEGCTLKGRPCGPSHAMASPL